MAKARYSYTLGSQFGSLTIIGESGTVQYGGRQVKSYICRCNCGREEILPLNKLLKRFKKNQGCDTCVRGPCIICGKPVPDSRPRSNTCCEQCEQDKLHSIQLLHYAKRSAEPGFNQSRHEARKRREVQNPALRARRLETARKIARRPEVKERKRKFFRAYYSEMKAEIQFARRVYFDSLPPDEQERIREKRRDYDREYKRKFREWLRANPDLHEQYKAQLREKEAERQRRQVLADLLTQSQKLLDKKQ